MSFDRWLRRVFSENLPDSDYAELIWRRISRPLVMYPGYPAAPEQSDWWARWRKWIPGQSHHPKSQKKAR